MLKKTILINFLFLSLLVSAQNQSFISNSIPFEVTGLTSDIKMTQQSDFLDPEINIITLEFNSEAKIYFPKIEISWKLPAKDIQAVWTTKGTSGIGPDWSATSITSKSTQESPIVCLLNAQNENKLTFAVSDALNSISLSAGVIEETGEILHKIKLFYDPHPAIKKYSIQILIDRRKVKYWQAIKNVSTWWEHFEKYKPTTIPELARKPMYSTWYSFHQTMTQEELVRQSQKAVSLGCKTIIIDDGWQTMDNNRGYIYCGEWKAERFPDTKKFVQSLKETGIKVMFWFSVPYLGKKSKVYEKWKDKTLFFNKTDSTVSTLDPRFPDVRQYLIDIYKRAILEWDLDGLKLDFIDKFVLLKEDKWSIATNYTEEAKDGRDYSSVNEAVDKLMTDVITELKLIKPDVMIEFRQSYIGPLMRKYGNMFRAGDCPYNVMANRISTTNLRLLSGNTAVHSDPLMWHETESVEVAALQILNTLYAVPQISVNLNKFPKDHIDMIGFWMKFMSENEDVLQNGNFEPQNPELNYPIIEAFNSKKKVVTLYSNQTVVDLTIIKPITFIINAKTSNKIFINWGKQKLILNASIFNCKGIFIKKYKITTGGLTTLEVPPAGLVKFVY